MDIICVGPLCTQPSDVLRHPTPPFRCGHFAPTAGAGLTQPNGPTSRFTFLPLRQSLGGGHPSVKANRRKLGNGVALAVHHQRPQSPTDVLHSRPPLPPPPPPNSGASPGTAGAPLILLQFLRRLLTANSGPRGVEHAAGPNAAPCPVRPP